MSFQEAQSELMARTERKDCPFCNKVILQDPNVPQLHLTTQDNYLIANCPHPVCGHVIRFGHDHKGLFIWPIQED
jgi:hypothetical protein